MILPRRLDAVTLHARDAMTPTQNTQTLKTSTAAKTNQAMVKPIALVVSIRRLAIMRRTEFILDRGNARPASAASTLAR